MMDDLKKTTETLLQMARERGADEAIVAASHSVRAKIGFEKNDFNIATYGSQTSYGLKVHKNKRKGSASTNETAENSLKQTVDNALTLAEFSIPDEYLCLAPKQSYTNLPGRFDEKLQNLPAEVLRQLAYDFIQETRKDQRISIDTGEVEVLTNFQTMMNSNGLSASDQTTTLSWSIMGMGKTDAEVTSFDYLSGGSWNWEGSQQAALATGRGLSERLVSCFGARKGDSYKGKVLLSPGAVGYLLLYPIGFHISGQQIMDGKSRWADQLGRQVGGNSFTLIDDPFDKELLGARTHDGEGVAVKKTPIIEKGILKTHIDSCYSAKRRGTQTTGHAGGLHNISIMPGEKSKEDLIRDAGQLVVVERFSGNVDPVSGDFSGVAKNSHYYKDGKHAGAIKETMIAGNFFDLLKNIVATGNNALPFCNQLRCPYILVDGVSVTAG